MPRPPTTSSPSSTASSTLNSRPTSGASRCRTCLDSSGAWSPYLFGYYASLNLLDAKALFSNMKINELFDPGVKQTKQPGRAAPPVPQGLPVLDRSDGYDPHEPDLGTSRSLSGPTTSPSRIPSPRSTSPSTSPSCHRADQEQARFWHALPPGWEHMEYFEFLRERTEAAGCCGEAGFERLRPAARTRRTAVTISALPTVSDLLRHMETQRVEFKMSARACARERRPREGHQRGRGQDRRGVPELVRWNPRHRHH
jgi:hypothetical protein